MKKRLFVLLAAAMLIFVFTGCGVDLTNDTITHEAGQELNIDATAHFNVDEEKAHDFVFDISAVDINVVGEYEATATYKDQEYTLTVNVVDTTAPMVEFASRCVFTNDLVNTDITGSLEGIYDASEYTTKLIRFEYVGNLDVMDENAVKELTDKIPLPCDEDELMSIGTEEVPEEDGIYRSVLEIKDVHGNLRLEEVYVVYDTMGAKIEDVADKTVRVAKEDLEKEPEIDKSDYTITDNVDGKIKSEDIVCELELRDEDKHEWLVHVSYTDRAGNKSKADFLIVVKETTNASASNTGKDAGNKNTANASGSNEASGTNVSGTGATTGSVDRETYISPLKQAALDAGIGVVVCVNGEYGVLGDSNGYINGVQGLDYLYQYISSLGLTGNLSGGMVGAGIQNTFFFADSVTTIPTQYLPGASGTTEDGFDYTVDEDGVMWID